MPAYADGAGDARAGGLRRPDRGKAAGRDRPDRTLHILSTSLISCSPSRSGAQVPPPRDRLGFEIYPYK
jgi:hypothetical protein